MHMKGVFASWKISIFFLKKKRIWRMKSKKKGYLLQSFWPPYKITIIIFCSCLSEHISCRFFFLWEGYAENWKHFSKTSIPDNDASVEHSRFVRMFENVFWWINTMRLTKGSKNRLWKCKFSCQYQICFLFHGKIFWVHVDLVPAFKRQGLIQK